MFRQRGAPYPSHTPTLAVNAPDFPDQDVSETPLAPQNREHPTDPLEVSRPRTNHRSTRLAIRDVAAMKDVPETSATPRDIPVVADDGEVVEIAKKVFEYYKRAGVNLGMGLGTDDQ